MNSNVYAVDLAKNKFQLHGFDPDPRNSRQISAYSGFYDALKGCDDENAC